MNENELYNAILEKYNEVYSEENSVEFEQFLKSILFESNGIELLLNCDSQKYKYKIFILTKFLELSNYDYLSKRCTDENREEFFKELDKRVEVVQNMLIEYCSNSENIDISKVKFIYKNYIENFAPRRLESYVRTIKGANLLNSMSKLKYISTSEAYDENINYFWNSLFNFYISNRIDCICRITELNKDLVNADSRIKKRDIIQETDRMLSERIRINKNINDYMVNLINVYHSVTCDKIAENIGMRFVTGKYIDISIVNDVKILEKYLNSLCDIFESREDYPRNLLVKQNTVLNKIHQIVTLNILPKEVSDKFEKIFDERLYRKDLSAPDMSKYEKYFSGEDEMSTEMFKEFFDDISIIGFKEGIIPIQYLEFVIKQIIFSGDKARSLNINQYFRLFEDFTRNKAKVLSGKDVFAIFSNNIEKNNSGEYFKGTIKFNPEKFLFERVSGADLTTIFHEIRHYMIDINVENSIYNHLSYLILKENIISLLDRNFYQENYVNLYSEIDAEYFSFDTTIKFLESIISKDLKENSEYITILTNFKKSRDEIFSMFDDVKYNTKTIRGQKVEDIEKYFDGIVKENPTIIEENPILRVEYNDDGTRKSLRRILEDYIAISREKKNRLGNYDLYKYVLLTRVGADISEYTELVEVDIPKDLSDSTRNAIEKLRYAVINRGIDKSISEEKEIVAGKSDAKEILKEDEIRKFEKANENINDSDKKIISEILKSSYDERE